MLWRGGGDSQARTGPTGKQSCRGWEETRSGMGGWGMEVMEQSSWRAQPGSPVPVEEGLAQTLGAGLMEPL